MRRLLNEQVAAAASKLDAKLGGSGRRRYWRVGLNAKKPDAV
jgi:hypothetical protein